mmetsp:Transcript_26282/g.66910  ORF Transcript_26282/g.66910 Transcript_26282/m.66910 type:complete len:126 (-) Transcript_26282:1017-1394(-)
MQHSQQGISCINPAPVIPARSQHQVPIVKGNNHQPTLATAQQHNQHQPHTIIAVAYTCNSYLAARSTQVPDVRQNTGAGIKPAAAIPSLLQCNTTNNSTAAPHPHTTTGCPIKQQLCTLTLQPPG